ncbi:NUDIX hydrolase [Poritiphilus flavus]|uniref:NUDIX domain-containing protein n=1 Tax=Poritiphilus flavus TaxID=2697053 RepID=A0A6L9ED07_9FLAO|nr:NUDIX domain-containing protein [Poritiphilus flavus]NAS12587.1 NUDIX domain-containing protein [Poritiphilus flavus]
MALRSEDHVHQFEAHLNDVIPGHSIDCVILGYHDNELKVLLLRRKGQDLWSLPGGFIRKSEDLDTAATRILEERTGLGSIFLQQFYTFGGQDRRSVSSKSEIAMLNNMLKQYPFKEPDKVSAFLRDRFITTGYFALVQLNKVSPQPDFMSSQCEWKSLKALPELILDHSHILQKAIAHVQTQLNYLPIGLSLLSKKFTMQDLQNLYEVLLNRSLDRGNFQRKMLALNILKRHEKQLTGKAHKAPYLYSFDVPRYNEKLKKGIGFSF